MKVCRRDIAVTGLLAALMMICAAGCAPSDKAAEPAETAMSLEDVSKIRFAIQRLQDPKLFDSGFMYLCDVGKPAIPHVIKALETSEHGMRTGANMTLQGITGHRVEPTTNPKALAKRWREWWTLNKHRDMPIIEKRPAAEVVPPGPRGASGATAPIDAGVPVVSERLPLPSQPDKAPDFSKLKPASDDEKEAARRRLLEIMGGKKEPDEGKKPEAAPKD